MLEGYRIEHLGTILTIILVLTIILAFEATVMKKPQEASGSLGNRLLLLLLMLLLQLLLLFVVAVTAAVAIAVDFT